MIYDYQHFRWISSGRLQNMQTYLRYLSVYMYTDFVNFGRENSQGKDSSSQWSKAHIGLGINWIKCHLVGSGVLRALSVYSLEIPPNLAEPDRANGNIPNGDSPQLQKTSMSARTCSSPWAVVFASDVVESGSRRITRWMIIHCSSTILQRVIQSWSWLRVVVADSSPLGGVCFCTHLRAFSVCSLKIPPKLADQTGQTATAPNCRKPLC